MRACTTIIEGRFHGGELEPGTFHHGYREAAVERQEITSPDPIPGAAVTTPPQEDVDEREAPDPKDERDLAA